MLSIPLEKSRRTLSSIALALLAASTAAAQTRIVVPAGTVIIVRTTSPLQSATAKTGDTFETNVDESVGVNEYAVIPSGSKIRGTVTLATPATRQQSGVIEVVFDRLTLSTRSRAPERGDFANWCQASRH